MKKIKSMMRILHKLIKLFNFWKWPLNSYEDYQEWSILRAACKEKVTMKKFYENNPQIRIDKLSRLYTVVNVPNDYAKNKTTSWTYVMGELGKVNDLLIEVGLGDFVFPDISQVSNRSWLIVLKPEMDSLNLKSFLLEIIRWVFLYFFFVFTNSLIAFKFGFNFFNTVKGFFVSFWESGIF
jgi:hypothetical protein